MFSRHLLRKVGFIPPKVQYYANSRLITTEVMIPYRDSPRPGVLHSRIRLKKSNLNEQIPKWWGVVTEQKQVSGCTAGHSSFPSSVTFPCERIMFVCLAPQIFMFCFGHECGQKVGWYLYPNSYVHLSVTWLAAFRPRSSLGWNRIWKQVAKISPRCCGLIQSYSLPRTLSSSNWLCSLLSHS